MESKICLVKENGKYVGYAAIVEFNGMPITVGALDEPLEVIECTRDQLMDGFMAHPQEFVQTIDQNTSYADAVAERKSKKMLNAFMDALLE